MSTKTGMKIFHETILIVSTILFLISFPFVFAMETAENNSSHVSREALRVHEEELAKTQALSNKIAAPNEDAVTTTGETELDDSTDTMDITLDEIQE